MRMFWSRMHLYSRTHTRARTRQRKVDEQQVEVQSLTQELGDQVSALRDSAAEAERAARTEAQVCSTRPRQTVHAPLIRRLGLTVNDSNELSMRRCCLSRADSISVFVSHASFHRSRWSGSAQRRSPIGTRC